MNNTQKIKDIKYLINEDYSDEEPLNESQQKSKECFNRYCDDIEKDLKALEILKKHSNKILFHEWSDNSKTMSIQIFEKLNDEEYEILKEVLENERFSNY